MKFKLLFFASCFFCMTKIYGQSTYFPPLVGKTWDTVSVQQLGWCASEIDSLYNFLGQKNTRAFLLLKDGKIVLEKYFKTFTQDSFWYWASAGKTLTGFTVGIAQKQGFLKITDTSSKYLGTGWTSEPLAKENLITIRHQLSMSSGLDDGISNSDCTDKICLQYKADAGTRWAYHNAAYTILDQVVSAATGQAFPQYFYTNVRNKIGMNGIWYKPDFNNVYYSTPRSMARFGILMLNKGFWNGSAILDDSNYFKQMTNSSQIINPSYGYLTWLNGKNSFMTPGLQFVFPGSLCPNAPNDMFAAEGKNGQILNVVPSQNVIVIRMGDEPSDNGAVPINFNNDLWIYLNKIMCKTTKVNEVSSSEPLEIYPNPAGETFSVSGIPHDVFVSGKIYDLQGKQCLSFNQVNQISVSTLETGVYYVLVEFHGQQIRRKLFKP